MGTRWTAAWIGAVMALFFCGCSTVEDRLRESDLTLTELESRMRKATDPEGNFARSRTYGMLQDISIPRFLDDPDEYLVEVKFEWPDKFSLITYQENKPVSMWCSDGKRGWVADYKARTVKVLEGPELRRMLVTSQIGNPRESYGKIFPQVEVFLCDNEDGRFYRIDCRGEGPSSPFSIYVDAKTYLIRRVKFDLPVGSGRMNYDARIIRYEMREGVMIPMFTEIVQNGERQEGKITSYRLDQEFKDLDFMPPVF
ncbi:MAG: hypothetical protein MR051_02580 [Lentisphaeria bacterium]|nr:hypothetical protein [Lentisphaeria bacterium]